MLVFQDVQLAVCVFLSSQHNSLIGKW